MGGLKYCYGNFIIVAFTSTNNTLLTLLEVQLFKALSSGSIVTQCVSYCGFSADQASRLGDKHVELWSPGVAIDGSGLLELGREDSGVIPLLPGDLDPTHGK